MKRRFIQKQLEASAASANGRITVLTGPRQAGKTTLVRSSLPDYTYLSIEDPTLRPQYAALSAAQWNLLYPRAILDEVQKSPALVESIKAVYDQWPAPRYILLGSSQLLLLSKVKESLAGRCHILELYPLTLPELASDADADEPLSMSAFQKMLSGNSVPEFLPSILLAPDHSQRLQALDFLMKWGGYPALVAPSFSDAQRREWLSDYVATYLERDVRDLAMMRDLEPYRQLQQLMALNTAGVFNASHIAKLLGVSSKTAARYLEYLRLSYQVVVLPAWARNATRRLAKAPKVHFLDNGVLRAILKKEGAMTGAEWESLIVAELYKQAKQLSAPVSFYHLRTADGLEVDLLIECPDGYYAFEIKLTQNAGLDDARHLRNLQSMLDKPLIHSFVVSTDPVTRRLTPEVTAVHAAALMG